MRTYSSYLTDFQTLTNNTSTANQTLGAILVNDAIRYLVNKFYFDEVSYTTTTVAQQQGYNVPYNIKNTINVTVSIGGILWIPKFAPNRTFWDSLNVVTFYQDYPSFYYVYNGQLLLFPTPASNGNTLTINYKRRLTDLSQASVTNATNSTTLAATNGSTTVTASGGTYKNWMAQSGWLQIPHSTTDAANGDDNWYQIGAVASSTSLTLLQAYQGADVTGANFTIGDVPILPEDYQDLPLYRACHIYFTTRVPDPKRAQLFKQMYDDGYAQLNAEFGSKTTNVELTDTNAPIYNPNVFQQSLTGSYATP